MAQDVLTALGFKRKRYADFIEELENEARRLFGEDVNLSEASPMAQWIKLQAYKHAEANELAEKVWLSAHIESAEGISLDFGVKKYGLRRERPTRATGFIDVVAVTGTLIPSGALTVETAGEIKFVNTAAGVAVDGGVRLPIVALEYGPQGNVPAGTITSIFTPLADVESVSNPYKLEGGKNRETDERLRERYYATMGRGGSSTTDGVRVAMLEVPGVSAVVVGENDRDTWSGGDVGLGYPPHSIAPVVLGGDPQAIAEAIHSKKAGGIRSYGTEVRVVRDKSGFDQEIGFSYAIQADIYVIVYLTKNALFPSDGQKKVQDVVVQYIGGTDADNETYLGLGMSKTVVHAQIVGAIIKTVPGIEDLTVSMRRGTTGDFLPQNIYIGPVEVAKTKSDMVVVQIA